MKRETLLTVLVILLLIINVGTLCFMFLGGAFRPFEGHHHPPDMIVKKLGLNSDQQLQFKALIDEHRSGMMNLDESNKAITQKYLNLLKEEKVNTALKDSLEQQLADIQKHRADITLRHFESLKAICDSVQRHKFSELLPDLIFVMSGGPPPPHHPEGFHHRP